MQIYHNASLKPYHTFAIDQTADMIVEVSNIDEVKSIFQNKDWEDTPKLFLGQGSNILFTEHYKGIVLINRIMGIELHEDDSFFYLHVSGGEDWPLLVEYAVNKGIGGLENLAMIPGCVGSAPVQNIGAYGLEFKDVCDYVEFINIDTLEIARFTTRECQFGYRDSIFKHELKGKIFVTAVGIKLPKKNVPLLDYGPLQSLSPDCACKEIFNVISKIRKDKLPDPTIIGNAGSFFKNPVISSEQFKTLLRQYPDIIHYSSENGIKLAAGWMIEQCGLKGFSIGGAQVHPKQALVLVNEHHASSSDVLQLAMYIRQSVYERYGVHLEPEVRFVGETGEVFLDKFMRE